MITAVASTQLQTQATDSYITNGGFAFEVEEFAIQ